MSGDTLPPIADDTIPPSRPAPVIARGQAQAAVSAALTALVDAYARLESIAMACARALDEEGPAA